MSTTFLYLKLTANGGLINGDSTERHFERQIAVDDMKWRMSSTHEPLVDARDKKKVKTINLPKRVELTKAFDRSTTNLCMLMAQRKPFSEAVISMVKGFAASDTPRTLVDVTLTDGFVESVALNVSESDKAVAVQETVTLSFRTLEISYRPDAPGGRGDGPPTIFTLDVASDVT